MGDILFLLGSSKHLHKTFKQCYFNVGQRRRRWPIIEKLTAPTIFFVFVGYIASGSGYPGGVGDEIRGGAVQLNSDQYNYKWYKLYLR